MAKTKTTDPAELIAEAHGLRLTEQRNDSHDFVELHVSQIRDLIEAGIRAGLEMSA
jgi:hypothetical protein